MDVENCLSFSEEEPIYLSFSGCGFIGAYHAGALACLLENAPHLIRRVRRFYGSSAGALISACHLAGISCAQMVELNLALSEIISSSKLGVMDPRFGIRKTIINYLEANLPENIAELTTGKLFINLTKFSNGKSVLISSYKTKKDLIDALDCTSFIPVLFGINPPTFDGYRYIDGGLTDNLPQCRDNYIRSYSSGNEIGNEENISFVDRTSVITSDVLHKFRMITICPFSGGGDICPMDPSIGTSNDVEILNMGFRFTFENINRLLHGFIKPIPSEVVNFSMNGYNDALRYLQVFHLTEVTHNIISPSLFNVTTVQDLRIMKYDGNSYFSLQEIINRSEYDIEINQSSFCNELLSLTIENIDDIISKYDSYISRGSSMSFQFATTFLGFQIFKITTKTACFAAHYFNNYLAPILQHTISSIIPVVERIPYTGLLRIVLSSVSVTLEQVNPRKRLLKSTIDSKDTDDQIDQIDQIVKKNEKTD